jgi:hypothetical protein
VVDERCTGFAPSLIRVSTPFLIVTEIAFVEGRKALLWAVKGLQGSKVILISGKGPWLEVWFSSAKIFLGGLFEGKVARERWK